MASLYLSIPPSKLAHNVFERKLSLLFLAREDLLREYVSDVAHNDLFWLRKDLEPLPEDKLPEVEDWLDEFFSTLQQLDS